MGEFKSHGCHVDGCSNLAEDRMYCREHILEYGLAYQDFKRDDDLAERIELLPSRPPLLFDREDDWRSQVLDRAVLPRRTRLFCHERTSWWRIGEHSKDRRSYAPSIENPNVDLSPMECPVYYRELKVMIDSVMQLLTPREALVLRLRFGIVPCNRWLSEDIELHDCEVTYAAIGELIGLSRERVRQIENHALRKIRHPSRARFLKPFVGENYYHPQLVEKVQSLKVVRVDGNPEADLSEEAKKFFEEYPIPDPSSSSVWFLSWIGPNMPVGAKLGRRTIDWTINQTVGCDTGKEIGTYYRFPKVINKKQESCHQMLIWSSDPKVFQSRGSKSSSAEKPAL
jgi:RNA polymerase sigma factor (sigma-70 family)